MDIILKDINKSYGEKRVLVNFSAVFKDGSCTCIMGPSGCGKTTLANIIMGFTDSDSGRITGIPDRLSAVFQEDRLCEDFSAVTAVKMVLPRGYGITRIEKSLKDLGLGESMYLPVRELSGGMKRRVAVARALLFDYKLLILDEPLKGLDENTKKQVIDFINNTNNSRTMIIITHNADEAKAFGGAIINMK